MVFGTRRVRCLRDGPANPTQKAKAKGRKAKGERRAFHKMLGATPRRATTSAFSGHGGSPAHDDRAVCRGLPPRGARRSFEVVRVARKYLIETFGCQMNVHDSERM